MEPEAFLDLLCLYSGSPVDDNLYKALQFRRQPVPEANDTGDHER